MSSTHNDPAQTPRPTHTTCPYPSCSWHSTPSTGRRTTDQLRLHIQQTHPDQPTTHLTDRFCQQHNLHPCRHCNDPAAIYLTPRHLQAHTNRSHCRQTTNLTIIQNTLRHLSPTQIQQWQDQLAFLYQLELTPPPFRRSSFTRLKPQAKRLFLQTMNMIVDWTNQASLPFAPNHTNSPPPKHNTESVPFWKLLLILEALLLAPIKNTPHRTHHNALKHRVAQLKQGDLILLYHTIWHPPPPTLTQTTRTNKHKQRQHNTTPTTPTPETMATFAQQAADLGNLRAAHNRLTATMPIATLTPERIDIVSSSLYPPRIDPPHHLRNHIYTPNHHTSIPDSTFEKALHRLSQGTAPGPFSASIDTLRNLGLQRSTSHPCSDRPYFNNLKTLFTTILNNQIPPPIRPLFLSIHFFALHKDLNNLNKLRPIGIGTALRRTAATIALTLTHNDIEPFLTQQGQYGINTSGGVNFTAHLTQQQIDKYITTTDDATTDNTTKPPSRALVLLDLTNMFNACSRSRCREILQSHDATKPLVALFDLLYASDTNNWYQDPDGNNKTLNQPEGFSQGCPLSPLFACLVLATLTTTINKNLSTRALERIRQQLTSDDNLGGLAHTASVMDDTSVCLLHEDLMPFLHQIDTLGKPFGIHLNKGKTRILSSTNGTSPVNLLSPANRAHLQNALSFLNPINPADAEITTGTRFLGHPIGNDAFIQQFLSTKLDNIEQSALAIRALHNSQTKSILFRSCILPKITHLLTADILLLLRHRSNTPPTSTLWQHFLSPRLDNITKTFLQHLTHTQQIPDHSLYIAHLSSALGGLGYPCHRTTAVPSLLNSLGRSLRLATNQHYPKAHTSIFFHQPSGPLTHSLQHHRTLPELHSHFSSLFPPSLPFRVADFHTYPPDAQRQLAVTNQETHLLPLIVASTPPELRRSLPSALSSLTSNPLHQPRFLNHFRIPNSLFETAVSRKLRLPFLPHHFPTHCFCASHPRLDPYGDHLFSCQKHHKTKLSNKLRDAVYFLAQDLAPRAEWTRTSSDVHLEPTNLLPHHPRNIRPADIGLALHPPLPDNRFRYLAIDITIPPSHPHLPPTEPSPAEQQRYGQSFDSLAHDASQIHHHAARNKFTHDTTTTALINTNNLLLLPFSIDHLGGLGHFAHNFFFGAPPWYSLSPSNPPSWPTPQLGRSDRCLPHTDGFLAFNNLLQFAPSNLIHAAQTRSQSTPAPFQQSLRRHATLTLGHAITTALAQHVLDALSTTDLHLSQQRKIHRIQKSSVFTVCPATRYFPHPYNPHTAYSVSDHPTHTLD